MILEYLYGTVDVPIWVYYSLCVISGTALGTWIVNGFERLLLKRFVRVSKK